MEDILKKIQDIKLRLATIKSEVIEIKNRFNNIEGEKDMLHAELFESKNRANKLIIERNEKAKAYNEKWKGKLPIWELIQ